LELSDGFTDIRKNITELRKELKMMTLENEFVKVDVKKLDQKQSIDMPSLIRIIE
jgi:regulator of replication initiation timing